MTETTTNEDDDGDDTKEELGAISENDNENIGDDESESEDSAREIIFDYSEEENDAHGGFEEENAPPPPTKLVPVANFRIRNGDSTATVQNKERKKKGRPTKGKMVVHEFHNEDSSDGSSYNERDVAKEMKQVRENKGLSDDEYDTEELVRHNKSTCKLPPPTTKPVTAPAAANTSFTATATATATAPSSTPATT
ncbi:hypothetical protein TSUD_179430 [Trifolium subterraneum]|uniref:Uncharacterized protein n=1 Tax=Trifolium subterraneum TaxID=3900 RepID=A0A2Z6NWV1_TRISU|nr:hypothetical protein TSUD_179430 [Trifolium subterraneum]